MAVLETGCLCISAVEDNKMKAFVVIGNAPRVQSGRCRKVGCDVHAGIRAVVRSALVRGLISLRHSTQRFRASGVSDLRRLYSKVWTT